MAKYTIISPKLATTQKELTKSFNDYTMQYRMFQTHILNELRMIRLTLNDVEGGTLFELLNEFKEAYKKVSAEYENVMKAVENKQHSIESVDIDRDVEDLRKILQGFNEALKKLNSELGL